MVDPGILHSVILEACMGFLFIGVVAIVMRIASDAILRTARAHSRLAAWARSASRFADPAATFALVAGVLGTTLAIATGAHTLSTDARLSASSVPADLQAVAATQGVFLGAVLLRLFVGPRIWARRTSGASYASLVLVGGGVLALENPTGVPLVGEDSLLRGAVAAGAGPSVLAILSTVAPFLLLATVPVAALGLGLRLSASRREAARRQTERLARDVGDLLGHAKRAGLETATSRRLIRQASAAARQRWYSISVRLMARAKRDLMSALSFHETPEGDWLAKRPEIVTTRAPTHVPVPAPARPPAQGPAAAETRAPLPAHASARPPAVAPVRVAAAAPRPVARGNLATAVGLAQRRQVSFAADPLEAVQEELQEARTALLDMKIVGRDIRQAIGTLKDANDHVLREEWDEALECLRAFRREIRA